MYRDSEIGVVFHQGVMARSAVPLRLAQFVNVLFSLVYGGLVARFLLTYVRAPASPFGLALAKVTNPVYLPIRALIHDGHDRAGHPVAWGIVVAIVVCAVLQLCIVSWLRDVARPRLEEQ